MTSLGSSNSGSDSTPEWLICLKWPWLDPFYLSSVLSNNNRTIYNKLNVKNPPLSKLEVGRKKSNVLSAFSHLQANWVMFLFSSLPTRVIWTQLACVWIIFEVFIRWCEWSVHHVLCDLPSVTGNWTRNLSIIFILPYSLDHRSHPNDGSEAAIQKLFYLINDTQKQSWNYLEWSIYFGREALGKKAKQTLETNN